MSDLKHNNDFLPPKILFCRKCGNPTVEMVPPDDNRLRAVCTVCGTIHYQNPINVVGTLPVYQNKILLCKRNIEPQFGKWTLPAGFLEIGESIDAGAARETMEEAGMAFNLGELFAIIDVAKAAQIHFYFLAQVSATEFNFGTETSEVKLFALDEIPWDELAFVTVKKTLEQYVTNLQQQRPQSLFRLTL